MFHTRLAELLKLHYFGYNFNLLFYLIELKLCMLMELCIIKDHTVCFQLFLFSVDGYGCKNGITRLTAKNYFQVMAKQIRLMILKGHVNEMQLRNSWKRSVVQKILHFFIGQVWKNSKKWLEIQNSGFNYFSTNCFTIMFYCLSEYAQHVNVYRGNNSLIKLPSHWLTAW